VKRKKKASWASDVLKVQGKVFYATCLGQNQGLRKKEGKRSKSFSGRRGGGGEGKNGVQERAQNL